MGDLEPAMPEASTLIEQVQLTASMPSHRLLQISRSQHSSPAPPAPHHTLPHCTVTYGDIGNHRVLHSNPCAYRLPGAREFATIGYKGAIEWHVSSVSPQTCPGGGFITRWSRLHTTEHKPCPIACVSSARASSSHSIVLTTLMVQRSSETCLESHSQ